jgi:hypothetical protein
VTGTVPAITAVLAGRAVTPEGVHAWESARLRKAAAKIGLPVPAGDLAHQRVAFADSKLELGAAEIRLRLARDIRRADALSAVATRLSRRRRITSTCDLYVSGVGTAAEFVRWFLDTQRDDYARSMIAANPDHFLIDTAPDGRQEVIETTGGSPAATRFLIDYDNISSLTTPRDPEFPLEVAGVARTESGLIIGGVRHEFRHQRGGFHARLCVEFPRLTPGRLISQHRMHLACEFSNWINFAYA